MVSSTRAAREPTERPTSVRILVVDDEPDLRRVLSFNLFSEGFAVEAVATAAEAFDAMERERPACMVLDVMLPDQSGIDVCRAVRAAAATRDLPVILLTARVSEEDRLLGFKVGADDYVQKPFSVREVVMRIRALLRRTLEHTEAREDPAAEGRGFRWRELEIDLMRHRVRAGGEELPLRPLEFKLLSLLVEYPGRVFSREELLKEVWGIDPATSTRTVDVHVRRLRSSLGTHADLIETVHGVGYRLRDA